MQSKSLKEKNLEYKRKVAYLEKQLGEKVSLIQKFILNKGSEESVKGACVSSTFKSKIATLERQLQTLKK